MGGPIAVALAAVAMYEVDKVDVVGKQAGIKSLLLAFTVPPPPPATKEGGARDEAATSTFAGMLTTLIAASFAFFLCLADEAL